MDKVIKGKVRILGDNVDTDQIYPGKYLELTEPEEMKEHCLEGVDSEFSRTFRAGDILVGGKNFGCGSSREHAAMALVACGAAAIVAESFARIFYRNGINLGIPLIVCKGIRESVKEDCLLSIDMEAGELTIEKDGNKVKTVAFEAFSEYSLSILSAGGIKNLLKEQ